MTLVVRGDHGGRRGEPRRDRAAAELEVLAAPPLMERGIVTVDGSLATVSGGTLSVPGGAWIVLDFGKGVTWISRD